MIVAVSCVGVVQVFVDEVVDVVAVPDLLVPATGGVNVRGVVLAAAVLRGTALGILLVHVKAVLVDVIAVGEVKVPVVHVIDVVTVLNRCVAACRAVLVLVALVDRVF